MPSSQSLRSPVRSRRRAYVLLFVTIQALAQISPAATKPAPLSEHERAQQAVARLTFGARPGEIEQVERLGVDRWIEQQLHPGRLDDAALETRLADLPAMRLSTAELIRRYPPGPVVRQIAAGKVGLPSDPVERVIYANELEQYRERQQAKAVTEGAESSTAQISMANENMQASASDSSGAPLPNAPTLLAKAPDQRYASLLAMQPGTVRPFLQHLTLKQRQQLAAGLTAQQKEVLLALAAPQRVVAEELMQEKLLREIYSRGQLQEVMTDFWFNHFNIYIRKNDREAWYLATYERDVIRPRALGHFEDLLEAVAHSPAMLMYLDNQESIGPHSLVAIRAEYAGKKTAPGLNENYARELMELHTLGVNSGYTQRDVTELAKVLTGWGLEPLERNGPRQPTPSEEYGFVFNERRHEPGDKLVLGHRIHENGEAEGREVLHMLAESPATAHFLSTKLAIRFVNDTPPPALVDRMAKTYLKTHGDISKVIETMVHSPEFWSRDVYRGKLKTPQEFVVSAVRASGAQVDNAAGLVAALNRLGMPLYGVQQPNGYSWKADPWLGGEALLNRLNFALGLTANRVPGVTVALPVDPSATPQQTELVLESTLLNGEISPKTHEAILSRMADPALTPFTSSDVSLNSRVRGSGRGDLFLPPASASSPTPQTTAAALLLGSPEFQRR